MKRQTSEFPYLLFLHTHLLGVDNRLVNFNRMQVLLTYQLDYRATVSNWSLKTDQANRPAE